MRIVAETRVPTVNLARLNHILVPVAGRSASGCGAAGWAPLAPVRVALRALSREGHVFGSAALRRGAALEVGTDAGLPLGARSRASAGSLVLRPELPTGPLRLRCGWRGAHRGEKVGSRSRSRTMATARSTACGSRAPSCPDGRWLDPAPAIASVPGRAARVELRARSSPAASTGRPLRGRVLVPVARVARRSSATRPGSWCARSRASRARAPLAPVQPGGVPRLAGAEP